MWQAVGAVTVNAETQRVSFGPLAAPADARELLLRITTVDAGSIRPLAFGIVSFVGLDGTRSLGSAKYFPDEAPTVVKLGPGPDERIVGTLDFRPRSYNLRWLAVGHPSKVWTLSAEVYSAEAVADPIYRAPGFVRGLSRLLPFRGPVGPGRAYALKDGI